MYKVLVDDEHNAPSIVGSRNVTFDESLFPGVPNVAHHMSDEDPSDEDFAIDTRISPEISDPDNLVSIDEVVEMESKGLQDTDADNVPFE